MQDSSTLEPQVNNYFTNSDFENLISGLTFSNLDSSSVKKATTKVGLDEDDVGVFKHDDNLYFCINNAIYKFDNRKPLLQQLDSIKTDSEDYKFQTYVTLITKIIRRVRGGKETDHDDLTPSEIDSSDLHHLNMGLYSYVVQYSGKTIAKNKTGRFILADDIMIFDENNTLYSLKSANKFLFKQFKAHKTKDYFDRIFGKDFATSNRNDYGRKIEWDEAGALKKLASENKIYELDEICEFLTSLIDASTKIEQEQDKPSCFFCSPKKPHQLTFTFADGTDRKLNLKDFFEKNLQKGEYERCETDIQKLNFYFNSASDADIDSLIITDDNLKRVLQKLNSKLSRISSSPAPQDKTLTPPSHPYFTPKIIINRSRSIITEKQFDDSTYSWSDFNCQSILYLHQCCVQSQDQFTPSQRIEQVHQMQIRTENESSNDHIICGEANSTSAPTQSLFPPLYSHFQSPYSHSQSPELYTDLPLPIKIRTENESSNNNSIYGEANSTSAPTQSLPPPPHERTSRNELFSFDPSRPLIVKTGANDRYYLSPFAGHCAKYYATPSTTPSAAPSAGPSNATSEIDIFGFIKQGFDRLSSTLSIGFNALTSTTQEPSPPNQDVHNRRQPSSTLQQPILKKGYPPPRGLNVKFAQDAGNETQTANDGKGAMTQNCLWV